MSSLMKICLQEINKALLPYWRKEKIRDALKELSTLLIKRDREATEAVAKKVLHHFLWQPVFCGSGIGR